MSASKIWLTVRQASELLGYADDRTLRRDIRMHPKKYRTHSEQSPTGTQYRVLLSSLPEAAQHRYATRLPAQAAAVTAAPGPEVMEYHRAPQHARRKADKYTTLLTLSRGLKGRQLETFVERWNLEHPDQRTSYSRILAARAAYETEGLCALIGKTGRMAGYTSVRDLAWQEYFESLFLKEGGPPLTACWEMTLGMALQKDPTLTRDTFPSYKAFERLLKKRVPASAIYRAREGYSRWYRKYAMGIARDYSDILPGDLWVSDHAQLDVMVTLPNGRTCRPWLTVWMDVKSSKILGWNLHAEAPNSDHIFQAFYHAALRFGIPREVYIDNGKDYRALDLSGGRSSHAVRVEESRALSLFSVLGIIVHFALPYNAQSKTIERRFLELKNRFSRSLVGFTGGNVVEKPEALQNEIRLGKLLTYDRIVPLVDTYIAEVYNLRASKGIVLQGQSPDGYYLAHAPQPRTLTADALMLFCTRICLGQGGLGIKVGRDGVKDTELGITYWAEWMQAIKGLRVYLRRDPRAVQSAWVFNADTHAFLGMAVLVASVHMIARGDVQKADLKERMAQKRREDKLTRSYLPEGEGPSAEDRMRHLAAGVKALSGTDTVTAAPAGAPVELTPMDHVLAERKRQEAAGTSDLGRARPPEPAKKPLLFKFAFEREEEEARQRAAGA